MQSCATTLEVEHSRVIPIGTRCLEGRLIPTCLQPLVDQLLVDLEVVVVDNPLIVHRVTTALAHHHFVLMLTKHGWPLCLVHLEEMVLEVDLVVAHPVHTHPVEMETKRRPRHSP